MDKTLDQRLKQSDPHLFLLLGQLPDGGWHHRIVRAPDPKVAHDWWVRQTTVAPTMILLHAELEAALASMGILAQKSGTQGVWGGWFTRPGDNAGVDFAFTLADSPMQAHNLLLDQIPAGGELLNIVNASAWLGELARMRAIVCGEITPDIQLS